jgi:hypothetical protein
MVVLTSDGVLKTVTGRKPARPRISTLGTLRRLTGVSNRYARRGGSGVGDPRLRGPDRRARGAAECVEPELLMASKICAIAPMTHNRPSNLSSAVAWPVVPPIRAQPSADLLVGGRVASCAAYTRTTVRGSPRPPSRGHLYGSGGVNRAIAPMSRRPHCLFSAFSVVESPHTSPRRRFRARRGSGRPTAGESTPDCTRRSRPTGRSTDGLLRRRPSPPPGACRKPACHASHRPFSVYPMSMSMRAPQLRSDRDSDATRSTGRKGHLLRA